jgi:hypothetical protein
MGILRQRVESSTARTGERFAAGSSMPLADQGIENRDLALAFLLGVFALAGAAALTIVLT